MKSSSGVRARLDTRTCISVMTFILVSQSNQTPSTMPKRKVVEEVNVEQSELSSPPDDLPNGAVNGTKKSAKTTTRKRKVKVEEDVDEKPQAKKGKKRKLKVEEEEETAELDRRKKGEKRAVKVAKAEEETAEVEGSGEVVEKKSKRKRKTKEEKEAEAMPLAARTIGHKLFIGAHVSSAGGQYLTLYSYRKHPDDCQAFTTRWSTACTSAATPLLSFSNHNASGPIHLL